MTPTLHAHLPLGVIRSAFGKGRCAMLVDSELFIHSEISKLASLLSAAQRAQRYWVFTLPDAGHSFSGASYNVNENQLSGFMGRAADDYDGQGQVALTYFESFAKDCGKSQVRRAWHAIGSSEP